MAGPEDKTKQRNRQNYKMFALAFESHPADKGRTLRFGVFAPFWSHVSVWNCLQAYAEVRMTINIYDEQLVPMTHAAKLLPCRPHVSTLWRWRKIGVKGIRLETIAIGGTRFTSREALQRFADSITAAHRTPEGSSTRRRKIAQANAELDEAGI
jgi:hypothetical protein